MSRREELTNPLAPTPLRRRAKQHRATLAAGYRLGPEDDGWLAVNVTDRGALLNSFKHTLGAAVQFTFKAWQYQANCFCSAGAVRNNVLCCCSCPAQISFRVRSILRILIICIGVNCSHQAVYDTKLLIQDLCHWSETISGT